MIEIERKYRLNPTLKKSILDKITEEYGNLQTVNQIDEVFLLNKRSFHEFTAGDPVFRLRVINDKCIMTLKKVVNSEGDAIEHEFEVSSYDEARAFLEETGCNSVVTVKKTRRTVSGNDGMVIAVDDVDKLGSFLEIEIVAPKESPDIVDRIRQTAARLGLNDESIESKKYDRLLQDLKSS